MTKEQDLAKLEGIVENLLLRFNVLKHENVELKAQVKAKEDKIDVLGTQIDTMTVNKSEVHGRVSSLIDSIEDWEKSFSDEAQGVSAEDKSSEDKNSEMEAKGESQLFSIGE